MVKSRKNKILQFWEKLVATKLVEFVLNFYIYNHLKYVDVV